VAYAVVLAAVGAAWGEETAEAPEDAGIMPEAAQQGRDYALRIGKLGVRPYFRFWAGYDDEVYVETGENQDAYYHGFAPGVHLRYGGSSRRYVDADYCHEWWFYDGLSSENYEADVGQVALHLDDTRTALNLAESLRSSTEREPETQARVPYVQSATSAEVERRVTRKTSVAALGSYELRDFGTPKHSEGTETLVDSEEYRAAGRGYYRLLSRTDVFADYAHGWVYLQEEPGSYGDAQYDEPGAGVRGRPTARTTATGRVGYHRRTFEGDIASISTWVTSLSLDSDLPRRTQAGLTASRRVTPSVRAAGDSVESFRLEPRVRRSLWRDRLVGALSGSHEWRSYYDPEGEESRHDTSWSLSAMVDYFFTRRSSAGVGLLHAENRSSDSGYQSDRDQLFVRASMEL
jgi:hypothetical protein